MIWRDGESLDDDKALLRWTDAGFVSGAVVVDNCRTWHGRLFRWQDHLERFRNDCDACCIPLLMTDRILTIQAERLLKDVTKDVHVVTFATPEFCGMELKAVPWERNERLAAAGAMLVVAGESAQSDLQPASVKHRSRMQWHIAGVRAQDVDPEAIAVLTDAKSGSLLETAIGNLIAIVKDTVVIPNRSRVLPGIGLKVVLEFCTARGWRVREGVLRRDLQGIQELMMVGSGFGVCGVNAVDEVDLPCPGPRTRLLMADWAAATRA